MTLHGLRYAPPVVLSEVGNKRERGRSLTVSLSRSCDLSNFTSHSRPLEMDFRTYTRIRLFTLGGHKQRAQARVVGEEDTLHLDLSSLFSLPPKPKTAFEEYTS